MENKYRSEVKRVTWLDLGWTEDEYNNFMIDVFRKDKKVYELPIEVASSKPIALVITKENYFNEGS